MNLSFGYFFAVWLSENLLNYRYATPLNSSYGCSLPSPNPQIALLCGYRIKFSEFTPTELGFYADDLIFSPVCFGVQFVMCSIDHEFGGLAVIFYDRSAGQGGKFQIIKKACQHQYQLKLQPVLTNFLKIILVLFLFHCRQLLCIIDRFHLFNS